MGGEVGVFLGARAQDLGAFSGQRHRIARPQGKSHFHDDLIGFFEP